MESGVGLQFRENGSRHSGVREHNNTLTPISLLSSTLQCMALDRL